MTLLQLSAEDFTTEVAISKTINLLSDAYDALQSVGAAELTQILDGIGFLQGQLEDIKIEQYAPGEWEAYAKANNGGL